MTIAYRSSDSTEDAHAKGRAAHRGGIPRRAPATYRRSAQQEAWLWGWDHEKALAPAAPKSCWWIENGRSVAP